MNQHPAYVELGENYLPCHVWSGFLTFDEVLDMAIEGVEYGCLSDEPPDEVDEDLIKRLVREEFDRKAQAEQSWPEETDCDRLTKAFEELTSKGILSVENNGGSITDGWAEWDALIEGEWIPAKAFDTVRGGCFYHAQDLERAVVTNELWLAFCAQKGTGDADEANIAKEICDVLTKFGFKPEWDGDVKKRINVPIDWKRRYGPGAKTSPEEFPQLAM